MPECDPDLRVGRKGADTMWRGIKRGQGGKRLEREEGGGAGGDWQTGFEIGKTVREVA